MNKNMGHSPLLDAIDKACQEIHDGSATDELIKILLNLSFHSAITSAIEVYVLSETVFEDWVTFQYHEDAMKLQDLNITIIYQSSTAKKMYPGE
jgi:hypothetical protein